MSHPAAFELATRIAAIAPAGLDHVFFTNSGSEAVDTALKIARVYHRARGEGARTRFIGRAKAYHGMGWGGLSVSGIGRHRAISGRCCRRSTTCRIPITSNARRSRAAGRNGRASRRRTDHTVANP